MLSRPEAAFVSAESMRIARYQPSCQRFMSIVACSSSSAVVTSFVFAV
jgi:hypothetical protein